MAVYFAQAIEGGPIKVGFSNDVPARIRQLEMTYGRPLALLGTMPGGRDEERAIHERFSHLRLGRTEQFRPESDLLAFIGRPLFVNATPVSEPMEAVDGRKPMAIQMRGSQEWKDWLEGMAAHFGLSVTSLCEFVATKYARENGHPPPPKR